MAKRENFVLFFLMTERIVAACERAVVLYSLSYGRRHYPGRLAKVLVAGPLTYRSPFASRQN